MPTTPTVKPAPAKLHPAEIAKLEAEAASYHADARRANAEAAKEEALAKVAHINYLEEQRSEDDHMNSDYTNNRYNFYSPVGSSSVQSCISTLSRWSRRNPRSDIEIVFNSPGGSVIDGMALFDYVGTLRHAGHKVTTGTLGYAASMAGILLQAGDHRWIGEESYLMIHEISSVAGGKIGEIKDEVKFYDRISERVVDIFVNRSGGKISKEKFKKSWERQDWWLDSAEALKLGFVDAVR